MRYTPELRREALQMLADGQPVRTVAAAGRTPMRYTPELRREALQMLADGQPVRTVAAALGLRDQTLYQWRRRYLPHLTRTQRAQTVEADLTAARKRITELETELAVMRRATQLLRNVIHP
ncbi:transposase [Streptomyces sp. NPDC001982]|uniref:transposase n=1 Tax=unclassified Streptomyces TaxID=2593676 RepID=UPI0033216D0A